MTRRMPIILLFLIALFLSAPPVLAQDDAKDSRDHPLITRMPGFYIDGYAVEEFAAYEPTVIGGADVRWEGKKFAISYARKDGATPVSPLQIVRNYEAAVAKAGGTRLGGDERRIRPRHQEGRRDDRRLCGSLQRRPLVRPDHRRNAGDAPGRDGGRRRDGA